MSCNGMAFFSSNFMFQTPHEEEDHHQPSPSLNPILHSSSPHHFHGMVAPPFLVNKRSMSYTGIDEEEEEGIINGGEDEFSDDGSQAASEKKRRLNMEQVKTLEKNFELGNKLDPERKLQLARALGLQPRQIAIWFQNRRARWKTKQLEKDYGLLKKQFEAIKADNHALQAQNQKLLAQIMALKGKEPAESINLNKETEGSCSNRSDNSSDIKLEMSRTAATSDSHQPLSNHPIASRSLFPCSSSHVRPTGGIAAQLFSNINHPSSSSSRAGFGHNSQNIQCQKIDQMVKEEGGLSNMFCGIDEQSGFWPWFDQQHFN